MEKIIYSKNDINKAGEVLAGFNNKILEQQAYVILQFFRSIHIQPLMAFRLLLIRHLGKIKLKNCFLLSQRLKRTPSIVRKLKLNKNMSLSTMQDVGGLRVVLDNNEEVYKLRDLIRGSEDKPAFKSSFLSEDDYIKNPKSSGYRSLHLIYKYEKNLDNCQKCRIEIQLRTRLQHAWATAVEVLGTYLNQPLKQSRGRQDLLDLLKKISKAFVVLEEGKLDENLFNEVKQEVAAMSLIEKLQGFKITTDYTKSINDKGHYFLISLYFKERRVEIKSYQKNQYALANENYTNSEKKYSEDKNVEVVLVVVDDINQLIKTYPNYFLDTDVFISYLNKIINP